MFNCLLFIITNCHFGSTTMGKTLISILKQHGTSSGLLALFTCHSHLSSINFSYCNHNVQNITMYLLQLNFRTYKSLWTIIVILENSHTFTLLPHTNLFCVIFPFAEHKVKLQGCGIDTFVHNQCHDLELVAHSCSSDASISFILGWFDFAFLTQKLWQVEVSNLLTLS